MSCGNKQAAGRTRFLTKNHAALAERARTASRAQLRYVRCDEAGIRRIKHGKGFVYYLPNGKVVSNARTLERIRRLAIPPAWTDVWICTQEHGHLQATGLDARGRKQYRYDARWRSARDEVKYHDLEGFAMILPRLRHRLALDMRRPGLSREKVLAAVVTLMAQTGARIGNDKYVKDNGSFGLTTLLDRHAKVGRDHVELSFRGKGGKPYRTDAKGKTLAHIVRTCRDVPGQRLFQYIDDHGHPRWIDSGHVNRYLQQLNGPDFTAKTLRTWVACVAALSALRAQQPAAPTLRARKHQLQVALCQVAEQLGNTPALCRKSYVHPALVDAFLSDNLPAPHHHRYAGLSAEESDLLATLRKLSSARAAA